MDNLVPHFIELIASLATDLPADVEAALRRAREEEAGLPRRRRWTRSSKTYSSRDIPPPSA